MPQTDRTPMTAIVGLASPLAPVDAGWLAGWHQDRAPLEAERAAAWDKIEAALPEEGRRLHMTIEAATNALGNMDDDLLIEQICAHLPGLAPAIRLVHEHTMTMQIDALTRCCGPVVVGDPELAAAFERVARAIPGAVNNGHGLEPHVLLDFYAHLLETGESVGLTTCRPPVRDPELTEQG